MTESREGSRAWTVAWFALAHLLLFTIGFHVIYTTTYADYPIYREYGRHMLMGQLPYRDFPAEYPPLALVLFVLPASLGLSSLGAYYAGWVTLVYVADVAALFALDGIAWRRGQSPLTVLGAYTALLAVVGPITVREFDIFPAVFTLLAIGAFEADRDVRGWFWLALGVMTKLYPILLAPVVLLRRGGRLSVRDVARGAAVGIAVCVAIMLPWLVLAPRSLLVFVHYHAARGLQLESAYASVVLLAHMLGLAAAATANSFGSWNVTGAAADAAVRISGWLMLAGILAAYAVCRAGFARRATNAAPGATNASLPACGALVLVAAIVTSKVLSPQYLIWLVPLLALATGPRRTRRWVFFAAIAVVTYYIFPRHYSALIAMQSSAVIALLVRNLLLLIFAVMLAIDILREPRGASAEVAA